MVKADGSTWINPYLMGTLQALESRTLSIRGWVSPSALGIIRNTATVVSQTLDRTSDNNSFETETPVNPTADVSVVKLGQPP